MMRLVVLAVMMLMAVAVVVVVVVVVAAATAAKRTAAARRAAAIMSHSKMKRTQTVVKGKWKRSVENTNLKPIVKDGASSKYSSTSAPSTSIDAGAIMFG